MGNSAAPPSANGSASTNSAEESERHREFIRRVLATPAFVRSARLSALLRHIAEKSLASDTDDLSEYQIGVQVFGRPESYSPGEDSIVRSHVRLLRQKLEEYGQENAGTETTRASIPKGAYSIHFEPVDLTIVADSSPVAAVRATFVPSPRLGRRRWTALAIVALAVTAGGLALVTRRPVALRQRFWGEVFQRDVKTFIVPADSALVLVEDLTQQEVTLSQYATQAYRNGHSSYMPDELLHDIAGRRYTSAADLDTIVRLFRMPQAQGQQPQPVVRYARDLRSSDLKEGTVIFLGGLRANPWETLFENRLSFRLARGETPGSNVVSNLRPEAGEQAQYLERPDADHQDAFGIVDYLPGLTSGKAVLIVQGTSAAGTECAADFLFDQDALEALLEKLGRGSGRIPFFEVLLRSKLVDGNAQQHEIVASRIVE